MQKRSQVIVAVVAAALVASGGYAAYVLSVPGNPCAAYPTALTVQPHSAMMDAGAWRPASSPAPMHSSPVARGYPLSLGSNPVINVVAAENFWGSLVSQIGGTHVNVTSIVTDPNTDPHEYQANDSDALAVAHAQYVIINNVGYDQWATALVASDGANNQTILNVGDSLGVRVGGGVVSGNPHLWYSPTYVNETVAWMLHNLSSIAPGLTGYFTSQYDNLTASLGTLYSRVTQIRDQFHGTTVAATEDIFVYLANATNLNLISPPLFMEAVAEGNPPPDSSVVEFQCQLESGKVKVLVYNAQTVTPITTTLKQIAAEHNVTTIFMTETIQPPDVPFQTWMMGELDSLQNALNAKALGS